MATVASSLDWSLVQAFLAVAENGSLSAAARAVGASQPTLGRQIKAMEKQLGAELFQRGEKGLSLTETGASLLASARAMRDAAHAIELQSAGQAAALEGSVRISASVAVAVHHLPAIVADVRLREPRIGIEIVARDDSSNLYFREADVAIRMYRPEQLDLVALHVGDLALGAFAARSYARRRGLPETPADLLSHDVVGMDRQTRIVDGFREAGVSVDRDWFKVRCDDYCASWAMVRAGCGIGFGQVAVGRADPELVEVPLGLDLPRLPVWLTAHEALRRTPRVARVWELVAAGLRSVCAT